MNDDWAKLAKFENEQTVIEEYRRKELEKERVANLRASLDAQMKEAEQKVVLEKEREMAYAMEERKALEIWHTEEQKKVEKQKTVRERLNQERAAQIADKETRQTKALARQKQEEMEATEMLATEHRRVKMMENAKRERQMKINEDLKQTTSKQLDHMAAGKQKEMADDIAYQKLAISTLDEREQSRNSQIENFKAMQLKRLEALGAASGGKGKDLKKWMDEKIIDRNFNEREALLDLQEEEAKQKTVELNMEQRRVLAAQLREKEARKKAMTDAETQRFSSFTKEMEMAAGQEEMRKAHAWSKRSQVRSDLEAQMREKAMRDDNPIMTEVERTINKKLLERVQMQSKGPPKTASRAGSRGSFK